MPKTETHRNLHPELHSILMQFHRISERKLRAVWHVYDESDLDKAILVFDEESLVIEAEPDDDTISFQIIRNDVSDKERWLDPSTSEVWSKFIGEPFGWGWITINQQDALDGILLSFAGITPQRLLTVVASSIKENIITAI